MAEYKDVAAIKTKIQKICDNCWHPYRLGGCPEHCGINDALKAIDSVPPAQPELCEYYALCRHGRDENKLRTRLGFCEYCNEDADGYVKPLEKNGHAFIRFGMNGWEIDLSAKGWHGSAKIRYCPMCGRDLLVK